MLVLAGVTCSCHPEKNKLIDLENIRTTTTDASELFFKNVRQSDYLLQENAEAKMNLFQLRDWPDSSLASVKIVINWYTDNAYLMFTLNPPLDPQQGFTLVARSDDEELRTYFQPSNVRLQIEACATVYNHIKQNHKLEIRQGDISLPFLEDAEARAALRITVFDYLRLVELR